MSTQPLKNWCNQFVQCRFSVNQLIAELMNSNHVSLSSNAVHPEINKYVTLFLRSLYTVYEEDVTVKGITGYRFVPPSSVFANLTVNPDNAGFCVPAGNCLGSGLLNVSVCKEGKTMFYCVKHSQMIFDMLLFKLH